MIQWGKQDVMFAGGCGEVISTGARQVPPLFDAMGAMSTKYNDIACSRVARL